MESDKLTCIFCGGDLSWDSEENASDISPHYDGDDEAIVHFIHCRKCGRYYEIYDPTKDEREGDYKDYWNTP